MNEFAAMLHYPEHESTTLEFKESVPKNDQIIKTVIGFCNLYGGKLVIGVNNDRQIVGLKEETVESLLESLQLSILQACSPPIIPNVYSQRFNDAVVLIIEVSSGMNKPYYRTSEGSAAGTYVRIGRSTVRATTEMIDEMRLKNRGISFDQTPLYSSTMADLNQDAFRNFLTHRTISPSSTQNITQLQSYGLIHRENGRDYLTVGGNLLFGQLPQRFQSEAFIIATHFAGEATGSAIASIDCSGTLFEQYEGANNFILSCLKTSYIRHGSKRQERLELPSEAIRELLVNAIVHRNYTIPGPSKVAVFSDRIEIFSPGILAGPMNLEHLGNGITYIRNPTICKVMREAGYIEKLGTGFRLVFDSCAKARLRRPTIFEGENFVKCVLWRAAAESEIDPILELVRTRQELSINEVVRALGLSRTSAGRRLNKLIESGALQRIGAGRTARYKAAQE